MFSPFYLFYSYLFYSSAQMWGKRGVWCFSCSLNLNIPAFISILTFRSICSIVQLYHFVSVPSLLFSCVIFTLSLGRKRQQSIQKRCDNHHGCVCVSVCMLVWVRQCHVVLLEAWLSLPSSWGFPYHCDSIVQIYDQTHAFMISSVHSLALVQVQMYLFT